MFDKYGIEVQSHEDVQREEEARRAWDNRNRDQWVPANGGTEKPFTTRTGRRVQYMWNRNAGRNEPTHAYLDLSTDMFIPNDTKSMIDAGLLW